MVRGGADLFQLINVLGSQPGARDTIRAVDGAAAFQGVGAASSDRFDFSSIDANTTAGGDQAFIFGGGAVDNDAAAEFEIEDGASVIAAAYTAADFFL